MGCVFRSFCCDVALITVQRHQLLVHTEGNCMDLGLLLLCILRSAVSPCWTSVPSPTVGFPMLSHEIQEDSTEVLTVHYEMENALCTDNRSEDCFWSTYRDALRLWSFCAPYALSLSKWGPNRGMSKGALVSGVFEERNCAFCVCMPNNRWAQACIIYQLDGDYNYIITCLKCH